MNKKIALNCPKLERKERRQAGRKKDRKKEKKEGRNAGKIRGAELRPRISPYAGIGLVFTFQFRLSRSGGVRGREGGDNCGAVPNRGGGEV